MKLVRYGAKGAEKPGLIDKSGQLRDLSAQVRDLDGEAYAPASLAKLAALDTVQTPRRRRQAALRRAGHRHLEIRRDRPELCDHAKETGSPIPTEPIFFIKANTALSGPNDAVEKPRGSTKLDWECEIAAIIGTRAKYVSEADALNHVAGYCVCNDVSERNFQIERCGQWTKGKSHDTFGPSARGW
jgi:2-keto-4-pentenoate hydratase/2-oxohepta-3-ene-1,7-dioic acid hydratase in catechol pathway